MISTDDCPQCQWLWSGQCSKPAQLDSYCCGFDFPQGCTLDMHWLNRDTERMEHVLLVGGRLWVGDVLSEFLLLTFLPAQQFFPPLSFCLCLFFFCRHWSHQCWGLNCSHSTQLNHLVCNGGSALYPLLWGMGAWPVYGSFQLTGLGVCLLGCQVKLESLKGFALRHSHPTFYRKNSPFFFFFFTTVVFFL